jgi:hypothetical protein
MEKRKTPVHRQPPLGGSHDFHAGFGVVTGRSSGLQACPINMTGISTDPSSRFQRKPVVFGCSILLTAAGQFRIRTGFPLTFPGERHQQTNHKIEGWSFHVNLNVAVFSQTLNFIRTRKKLGATTCVRELFGTIAGTCVDEEAIHCSSHGRPLGSAIRGLHVRDDARPAEHEVLWLPALRSIQSDLKGQVKSGQAGSLQNRPTVWPRT